MNDVKFAAWSAAESPVTIEYSLVVIEEIRHAVSEGFQRLSRGGIEVGGILYGKREDKTVRVLAMRPIACEHGRGPAFLLSDRDRMVLNAQLAADAQDPHLEGLLSVGWFLSHTRSDIMLSDSDLELYSIFFPAPWQVALVVRPGRQGSMRAGFFVREADGTVKADHSYLEFNFPDRQTGVVDRPPLPRAERAFAERPERVLGERSERVPSDRPERVLGERRANSAIQRPEPFLSPASVVAAPRREIPEQEIAAPTFGQPRYLPAPPPKKKWPWLVVWAVLVILAAGFGFRAWMQRPVNEPIALGVVEHEGQLRIEWNHAARPVTAAVRGTLVINDGSNTQTFALSPRELTAGNYNYERKTGDVEVRMSVEDAEGNKVQEASRFLGQPPVRVDEKDLSELKNKRDELQDEVDRLTKANRQQEQRIQQLQRTLSIMQSRSGNK
jgi:proteasome lid subunit RPN8/RPN11